MNLYHEEILDHYKHPRNKQELERPTLYSEVANPLCGDKLHLSIKIDNNIITEIGFGGEGCAISQAAMSMLTEELSGKSQEIFSTLSEKDVLDMLGVTVGPARLKCALLCLVAVRKLALVE